jgi:hypothetical protein
VGNDDPPSPPCFDVALVGRLVKQTYVPGGIEPSPDPDTVTLDSLFELGIVIEQRLAGEESRARITVPVAMHTKFSDNIRRLLLFLQRRPGGAYWVVGVYTSVIQDRAGRFVIPTPQRLSLKPFRWYNYIPSDYEQLLRPVRYAPARAWWLKRDWLDAIPQCEIAQLDYKFICERPDFDGKKTQTDLAAYPWGTLKGDWMVADRGLFLTDLVKADAGLRCSGGRGRVDGASSR